MNLLAGFVAAVAAVVASAVDVAVVSGCYGDSYYDDDDDDVDCELVDGGVAHHCNMMKASLQLYLRTFCLLK